MRSRGQRKPLVLYSVSTYLAYMMNERYYGSKHYVWCSEVFDATARNSLGHYGSIPPTSNPREIYHSLYEEVKRGDWHSLKIEKNRKGILDGAKKKLESGEINQSQYDEMDQIVNSDKLQLSVFRPLLYIIPYHHVRGMVREATVAERAHPLSLELIIEALDRKYFDPIEIPLR